MTAPVFLHSKHYKFEDWLTALGEFKTPWRTALRQGQFEVRVQGVNDPVLLTQNSTWHFAGEEPEEINKNTYRLKASCVVWIARGPVIVYCTPDQARQLKCDQAAYSQPKLVPATC